ncbi:acyl-CoA ligase (AMP-forming), exosortase A system-associated [Uliginosibacterium sp. H3]|uniref:Acyl-CoA ligase (AMP-forming), exosortase A system-associated n=1 Tax=Uliginosibacterium silvisoli TaxID=3114758 RepID=A0ABU6K5M7_9RHOO|nr:acyl-CoA ligase (AMP-forming), exosortase A system-associated [Uliginosibacterium sp. H3]
MTSTPLSHTPAFLLHDLLGSSAARTPHATALVDGNRHIDYASLQGEVEGLAASLLSLGVQRGQRVAMWMEKRSEMVVSIFASSRAGAAFVPINPLLKPAQVGHILQDCTVRILITTATRRPLLAEVLAQCPELQHVLVIDGENASDWQALLATPARDGHRVIDSDLAGIFYTSGSTGRPKGVMVSHRNVVVGAQSVASYLGNHSGDRLLAALPLSFDAGFSQLTTAFCTGASVVLLNYLLPRDVLKAMEREQITGLTAVPPLWIQLAQLDWPAAAVTPLRYFANTGGRMPRETLGALRQRAPAARPFLMYGLTEAFRATYLPPEEAERRPDSIGRAIPNAEVMVLREDGSECAVDEPGELVQRGALVAMGYWNDAEKTAERFRPLPAHEGSSLVEIAVFSGDTVRRDAEGFLYFIGRRDEMIKTSGYRVSPTEVEEACYATQLVAEAAAIGTDHPLLGQSITLFASATAGAALSQESLLAALRPTLPAWMLPTRIVVMERALPRNPNGKIDRKLLAETLTTPAPENAP